MAISNDDKTRNIDGIHARTAFHDARHSRDALLLCASGRLRLIFAHAQDCATMGGRDGCGGRALPNIVGA
jgi:hypothetical protein